MLPVQFLLRNPSCHPSVPSIIFGFGPLLLFPFLCSSLTVLVNNDALPMFSILFSDIRSCLRSKKPKSGHLHPHPRDACVGPAPAAPVMPSPTSMALEHSLCLEETCGQNHLLPQQEHFHQIVTNINTKDCKKQASNQPTTKTPNIPLNPDKQRRKRPKNQSKPKQRAIRRGGRAPCKASSRWWLRALLPLGYQIKDLGLSFHPHVCSDSSFFSKDVCCCHGRQAG